MDLKTRATNILTKPAAEWSVIAAEHTSVADLMTGYAAPLAALSAIASFVGQSFIGLTLPMVGTVRVGIVRGISGLVVGFVLALIGAFVSAKVVEQLAPRFQSRGDFVQALKLVVYSSTPGWLGGILAIIPPLTPLTILFGIYAIYIFYLGTPRLMHTPESQVIPYMIVSAIVIIIIYIIFGVINGIVTGVGGY